MLRTPTPGPLLAPGLRRAVCPVLVSVVVLALRRVVLSNILEKCFPEEYRERREEVQAEKLLAKEVPRLTPFRWPQPYPSSWTRRRSSHSLEP